jgi:hypothetical protein
LAELLVHQPCLACGGGCDRERCKRIWRRRKLRARGGGGLLRRRGPGGADGMRGAGLRRWGWWLLLGDGGLLQRWLGLRRCRRYVGSGGVIRHVELDSPGEAGYVRDGSIGRACRRKGIECKEARQQGCIDKRGPSVRVDLRGNGMARPREGGATFVY